MFCSTKTIIEATSIKLKLGAINQFPLSLASCNRLKDDKPSKTVDKTVMQTKKGMLFVNADDNRINIKYIALKITK